MTNTPRIATVAGIAALLLAVAPAPSVHAAPTVAGTSGCPAVLAAFMSGTWEGDEHSDPSVPVGVLSGPADTLRATFGDRVRVVFPASPRSAFDKGRSYAQSKTDGTTALKTALTAFFTDCPASKAALIGYSQGADSAGDVAADIGCRHDPIGPDRVIAVGLVADPHQGTAGGKLVGPQVSGTGIAGPRPGGFCAVSPIVAQFCDPHDRYCATDAATNPLIAGLGRLLDPNRTDTPGPTDTTPTGDGAAGGGAAATRSTESTASGAEDVTAALVSDFSGADPGGLARNVDTITTRASSTDPGDTVTVAAAASSLLRTLTPLAEVAEWARANPTVQHGLRTKATDSVDQQAARTLDTLQGMDLPAAIGSLNTIASALPAATGSDPGETPSPSAAGLDGPAGELADQLAPLTATPADQLATVTSFLSVLKPSVLIGQLTNAVTNAVSLAGKMPQILDRLAQIPPILTDPASDPRGKVDALQEVFGDLNTLLRPVVVFAAGVDLHLVARVMGLLAPLDTTGAVSIAATVVALLGNVDVVGLANQFGQLQNDLWGLARALASGADLIGIGTALLALVPTMLGFATITTKALTTGEKTPATAPDSPTSATTTGSGGLAQSAGALISATGSDGAGDLTQLVAEGADALRFFVSGAHQRYDSTAIDTAGRTALQWLTEWLINRITTTGAHPAPDSG